MKVLFLLIPDFYRSYERLGMMHMASYLKAGGHQATLLKVKNLKSHQILGRVRDFSPDILAYSVMTGEHSHYLALNQGIREQYACISVFGGPHPTFFPEMIEEEGVDVICRGEGELAMLELVTRLEAKQPVIGIQNLWVKDGKTVHKNPLRNLVCDLDTLLFPDREFMYTGDSQLNNFRTKVFMAGRGCPYQCSYCFNRQYHQLYQGRGTMIRYRSVDNLIEEIVKVRRSYPMDFIDFEDDTFILSSQEWLEELAQKYSKIIGLPFKCNVRPNLVCPDTVKALKAAGCYSVWIGIECGDERVSNELLGRGMANGQIRDACALLRRSGIKYIAENIGSLPVEDPLGVDFQTLALNIQCKPDYANLSIFQPYPGTALGEYASQKGYFNRDVLTALPQTNKLISPLTFHDVKKRKQLERLQKLFGVTVAHPFLLPLVKFLIRLPLGGLYRIVFFMWYAHCYLWRTHKTKKTIGDVFRLACSSVSYISEINRRKVVR